MGVLQEKSTFYDATDMVVGYGILNVYLSSNLGIVHGKHLDTS